MSSYFWHNNKIWGNKVKIKKRLRSYKEWLSKQILEKELSSIKENEMDNKVVKTIRTHKKSWRTHQDMSGTEEKKDKWGKE